MKKRPTWVIFSRSFTYAISPLISSKMILQTNNPWDLSNTIERSTHACRLASCLDSLLISSGGTRSCHSHFPGVPLPMATWNVLSCATHCKVRIASFAATKKSASGFSSAVSLSIASRRMGYFCRCSDGRFKKCLRSSRGESPVVVCCLEQC